MEVSFISPEMLQDFYAMSGIKDPIEYLEKEYLRRFKQHLVVKTRTCADFGCPADHKSTVDIQIKLNFESTPPYEINFVKAGK